LKFYVRFSNRSLVDIDGIFREGLSRFGRESALLYAALISRAVQDVAQNPHRLGVRTREELAEGCKTYHLFWSRKDAAINGKFVRKPRHLLVFRLEDDKALHIGRVLYEGMDFTHHLPEAFEEG
jgi:toxin ParE1/3/4